MINKPSSTFVWDLQKEQNNIKKHGIDFNTACKAFKDQKRKIFVDEKHSQKEQRYFCIGKIESKILTVRFIYRDNKIRIIGAGYWRKGIKYYEQKN